MAGRLYWEKCLPLILASGATITAAFTADPVLAMYAKTYYYKRWANMRATMGGGAMPFASAEEEAAQAATTP
jgi:hypothetical protein